MKTRSAEVILSRPRMFPLPVEILEKIRAGAPCICTPGDPCDYHAASCVVCLNGCVGHPEKS